MIQSRFQRGKDEKMLRNSSEGAREGSFQEDKVNNRVWEQPRVSWFCNFVWLCLWKSGSRDKTIFSLDLRGLNLGGIESQVLRPIITQFSICCCWPTGCFRPFIVKFLGKNQQQILQWMWTINALKLVALLEIRHVLLEPPRQISLETNPMTWRRSSCGSSHNHIQLQRKPRRRRRGFCNSFSLALAAVDVGDCHEEYLNEEYFDGSKKISKKKKKKRNFIHWIGWDVDSLGGQRGGVGEYGCGEIDRLVGYRHEDLPTRASVRRSFTTSK